MKPYIIADTTYNHEGDINYLLRMVDEIAELKLQAVKFHLLFNIDDYMEQTHPAYQKIKGMLIPEEKWDHIIEHATKQGLDVVLLCDDVASIRYAMQRKDIKELEIHSSGIVNERLLSELSGYTGDIMLGVGGVTIKEMRDAVYRFKGHVTLMYGFNGWSTDPKDINIFRMKLIRNLFSIPVGYADHTLWNHPDNTFISCAAALNGFSILEKHYTLTPGVERCDYKESVGREMMGWIRDRMNLSCAMYGGCLELCDAEKKFASKIRPVDGKRR